MGLRWLVLSCITGILASVSAFAQSNCPEKFTVTYESVQPYAWNQALEQADIRVGGRLRAMWNELAGTTRIELTFSRYTVSANSCYYSSEGRFGALQVSPSARLDILALEAPAGSGFQAFFHSSVVAFSASSIQLAHDPASLTLLAPAAYEIDSDGGSRVSQWLPVAWAKDASVTVAR